jgi:hypothetical protein
MADQPETATVRAHCNHCGGERQQLVRSACVKEGGDEEIQWSDKYEILECRGCEELSVRHQHFFDDYQFDDDSGLPTGRIPGVVTNYYPPALSREMPRWFSKLEDKILRDVLVEVYGNLQAGYSTTAAAGARILIDRTMSLTVGDGGGFKERLRAMVERGVIGQDEQNLMETMTEAGSAATHRGYQPDIDQLNTILDTIENLLHRTFVLKKEAESVRRATPPRG